MFIWYRREKLKSSIDFLPATETNVLQTSIPARCTLRAFRERWSMKKVDNSPNELTPVLTHTLMRSLQQHSPFFNNKGQSHTLGWHSKARVVKELLHFQLMNNTENSLRRVKRVSMNEKGQFVPDSPIPSAALWEHGVLCGDSPSFVLTGREGWEMEPCSEGENTARALSSPVSLSHPQMRAFAGLCCAQHTHWLNGAGGQGHGGPRVEKGAAVRDVSCVLNSAVCQQVPFLSANRE